MTIIAVAATAGIVKLVEVGFDGKERRISLHGLNGRKGQRRQVSLYRYVALATQGPWCGEELIAYGRGGQRLSEVGWTEIASDAGARDYNPSRFCRLGR
jgi:hypothetical protein